MNPNKSLQMSIMFYSLIIAGICVSLIYAPNPTTADISLHAIGIVYFSFSLYLKIRKSIKTKDIQ